MKFLSSIIILSVSAALAHKGDYRPFRAKTHKPKTLKVEPKGVFRAKTHKPKTLKGSLFDNGASFPNIEEGREAQNSEDGGLVNGTLPSSSSGGGDALAFDDDHLPSDLLDENTEWTDVTSTQHTDELNGGSNETDVILDDDEVLVEEDDDTIATGTNATIDEGVHFGNDTTTESQEDEDYGSGSNGAEAIKEDALNESAEGGGAVTNETSDNVTITTNEVEEDNATEEVTGINETAAGDDVIEVGAEATDGEPTVDQGSNENPDETSTAAGGGGEDGNHATSTNENGQQSSNYTHAENTTTAIVNPTASDNATDYYDDDMGSAFFVPNIDGETCDVGGAAPRSGIERLFEMPYFYVVETVSIDGVVEEIEGLLHLMLCVSGVERRLEEIAVDEEEAKVVGVNVTPEDIVSNEYVCLAQSKGTRCDVVEGRLTLIIEGEKDVEQEDDLKTKFYLQLDNIFDFLASVDDSNVRRLEYVGPDPSSLMTRNELIEEGEAAAEANEVAAASPNVFAIITIGATVVTLLSLIAFWKLKNKKDDEDDDTLDGKPIDDKSLAATAALTMTTYGSADESSDISSSVEQPPQDIKQFFKKPFVLAEEEETNWRNLGILPEKQLPLADIREEFSQSSADKSYVDEKSM